MIGMSCPRNRLLGKSPEFDNRACWLCLWSEHYNSDSAACMDVYDGGPGAPSWCRHDAPTIADGPGAVVSLGLAGIDGVLVAVMSGLLWLIPGFHGAALGMAFPLLPLLGLAFGLLHHRRSISGAGGARLVLLTATVLLCAVAMEGPAVWSQALIVALVLNAVFASLLGLLGLAVLVGGSIVGDTMGLAFPTPEPILLAAMALYWALCIAAQFWRGWHQAHRPRPRYGADHMMMLAEGQVVAFVMVAGLAIWSIGLADLAGGFAALLDKTTAFVG